MRLHKKDLSAEKSPRVAFDEASVVGKSKVKTLEIESPYLRPEEAAIYLRVSVRALEHYRQDGGGPAYRKHGGLIVYHINDLDRWSARRRFRTTSKKEDT